ncbi:hypothetical protein Cgig2_022721 [Carnegiea gigantea]|uniref:Uncharacterized protein n=1 Tax=Carnegiea gigantea TaxID=171969 RepID=A0A9Q1JSP6_9CARY|nr:hypothetical protein Cgig2_022721 [Carnegiea gigantea]
MIHSVHDMAMDVQKLSQGCSLQLPLAGPQRGQTRSNFDQIMRHGGYGRPHAEPRMLAATALARPQQECMEEAIEEMHGMNLDGRPITVERAQPSQRSSRGRDGDYSMDLSVAGTTMVEVDVTENLAAMEDMAMIGMAVIALALMTDLAWVVTALQVVDGM